MNIGVDILGGDFAPDAVLDGAILALEVLDKDDRLFLFGNEEYIRKYFANRNVDAGVFKIVNCSETIAMGDDPVKSFLEKKDSGMRVYFNTTPSCRRCCLRSQWNPPSGRDSGRYPHAPKRG